MKSSEILVRSSLKAWRTYRSFGSHGGDAERQGALANVGWQCARKTQTANNSSQECESLGSHIFRVSSDNSLSLLASGNSSLLAPPRFISLQPAISPGLVSESNLLPP